MVAPVPPVPTVNLCMMHLHPLMHVHVPPTHRASAVQYVRYTSVQHLGPLNTSPNSAFARTGHRAFLHFT